MYKYVCNTKLNHQFMLTDTKSPLHWQMAVWIMPELLVDLVHWSTDELSPGNATLLPFVYFPFFNGLLSPFTKYVRMAFRLGTHGLTINCFSLFLSIFPEKVYWMHVKAMLLHTKWTKWTKWIKWNMCTRENKSRIHRRAHVL